MLSLGTCVSQGRQGERTWARSEVWGTDRAERAQGSQVQIPCYLCVTISKALNLCVYFLICEMGTISGACLSGLL